MLRWPGGAEAAPEAASISHSQRAAPAGPAPNPPQQISELRMGLVQRGSSHKVLGMWNTKPVSERLHASEIIAVNTCIKERARIPSPVLHSPSNLR